jgi:SAM-dependent methyltransferase
MLDFIANRPADVATRETLDFLTSRIPAGTTILEVGCGEGQLARELLKRGYHVTALDANPNVIAKAQARGVPVVLGSWPKLNTGVAFDAIAFTRSLHHIKPLGDAIARARELLNPRGLFLIEDFALDEVDETTVHWFVRVLHSKQGAALISRALRQNIAQRLKPIGHFARGARPFFRD